MRAVDELGRAGAPGHTAPNLEARPPSACAPLPRSAVQAVGASGAWPLQKGLGRQVPGPRTEREQGTRAQRLRSWDAFLRTRLPTSAPQKILTKNLKHHAHCQPCLGLSSVMVSQIALSP